MTYTLENVGAAIRAHLEQAIPAALAKGLGPELGVEIADRVRVKTGRNRRSTHANKGKPREQDPGPAESHPPPARGDFEAELRGLKFREACALTQGTPYSAAREAKDFAVQDAIGSVEGRWPQVAGKAVRRGR